MSIRQKLMSIAALGVLLTIVSGVNSYVGVVRLNDGSQRLGTQFTGLSAHLEADMMHDALRGDLLSAIRASRKKDARAYAEAVKEADEHARALRDNVDTVESLPLGEETRQAVTRVKPELQAYVTVVGEIVRQAESDLPGAENRFPEFQERFTALEDRMGALSLLLHANTKSAVTFSAETATSTKALNVIAALVIVLVLSIGSTILIRSILRPIAESVAIADELAQGNLMFALPEAGSDELGTLIKSLGATQQRLHDTVGRIKATAHATTVAAEDMSEMADAISTGAQHQAANLEEAAAALEEITRAVQQSAENADAVRGAARESYRDAGAGAAVIGTAIGSMRQITAASNKIQQIVGAIDAIAFQTNLLSLNAAVEAARAGEQGRGFAVVASEVRTLAQQSATASKEIRTLVSESIGRVEEGAAHVDKSGATFDAIAASIKSLNERVAEIATASREQSLGIDQVNRAVVSLDQVTQSNAGQTSALASTAAAMREQAATVEQLVAFFRTGPSATASDGESDSGERVSRTRIVKRGAEPSSSAPSPRAAGRR